jgi:site-specific DNA-methyltransferase (adenine-specific)
MSPDLRLGDWRETLADVQECGSVITDPPFSPRTHRNMRSGSTVAEGGGSSIEYGYIEKAQIFEMVATLWPKLSGFFVGFGDHITAAWMVEAMEDAGGGYVFPPVPWVKTNGAPRFSGDGPACAVEFIAIGRKRGKVRRRFRPGYYRGPIAGPRERGPVGTKPLWLARAIVRDYSEPGDLILDPYCGSGSIILGAEIERRRGIGSEIDGPTHAAALEKFRNLYNADLFAGGGLAGTAERKPQNQDLCLEGSRLAGEAGPAGSYPGPRSPGQGVGTP